MYMAENTVATTASAPKLTSLSVGEVFGKAWEFAKSHFVDIFIVIIITAFATGIPSGIVDILFGRSAIASLLRLVLAVWNAYVSLGVMKYMIALIRGKKMDYMEIFNNMDKFGTFILVYFILAIGVGLGLVFFIIPGVIIGLMYGMSILLVADGKANGLEAFNMSAKMMEGHKMELFIYMIVTGVAVLVGLLFFIIPGLVAVMVSAVGFYMMYEYLLEKMPTSATPIAPTTTK